MKLLVFYTFHRAGQVVILWAVEFGIFMSMTQPQVIMVAGPNGAGKTSAALTLLPDFLQVNEFVYDNSFSAPKLIAEKIYVFRMATLRLIDLARTEIDDFIAKQKKISK